MICLQTYSYAQLIILLALFNKIHLECFQYLSLCCYLILSPQFLSLLLLLLFSISGLCVYSVSAVGTTEKCNHHILRASREGQLHIFTATWPAEAGFAARSASLRDQADVLGYRGSWESSHFPLMKKNVLCWQSWSFPSISCFILYWSVEHEANVRWIFWLVKADVTVVSDAKIKQQTVRTTEDKVCVYW